MGFLVKEAAERSADLLQQKEKDPALSILHEIGSRMAAASPLREVLDRILDFAGSVARFDSCFIFVLEEDELVLRASKNPPSRATLSRIGASSFSTNFPKTGTNPSCPFLC